MAKSTSLLALLLVLGLGPSCASSSGPTLPDKAPQVTTEPVALTQEQGLALVQGSALGPAILRTSTLIEASCASMIEAGTAKDLERLPLLQEVIAQHYEPKLLEEAIWSKVRNKLSIQELTQAHAWQTSPATARMIQSTHAVNRSSLQQRLDWWTSLSQAQQEQRLALATSMVPSYINQKVLRDTWVSLFSNAAWIILQISDAPAPELRQQMRFMVAGAVRATGLEKIKTRDLQLGMAYALREVSMEDQKAFADFWNSEVGRNYHDALWGAYPKVIEETASDVTQWFTKP